jgi:hypothetical protein
MEVNLPPAPAKVWDSLPGDPVGQVLPPQHGGDGAAAMKQPSGQGDSLLEKVADKLTGG